MEDIEKHLELIITEDGSSSLRRNDLQEGYHSTFGAISESKHIFIEAGLRKVGILPNINILEIGFGTGLNAILTLEFAIKEEQSIYYQTIEKYPLSKEITSELNYGKILDLEKEFEKIHSLDWVRDYQLDQYFTIHKIDKPAEELCFAKDFFHLIYFDAFAPQFEENLWTKAVFENIFLSLKEGGILVTYCCKGDVKRMLKSSGFQIEKLPGPKGKREILRAVKISKSLY
ncbi:MAG: tRNA (5-methylaminomethyl-2-thiouridine)(34)-methyltransferase MnmD [Bacteroidales bacterium]|nr:tRNA (5-methylaminomethyl-2-thiouridine)(34)-methyltransferase MnmD [Bacteroidales bacterium]